MTVVVVVVVVVVVLVLVVVGGSSVVVAYIFRILITISLFSSSGLFNEDQSLTFFSYFRPAALLRPSLQHVPQNRYHQSTEWTDFSKMYEGLK